MRVRKIGASPSTLTAHHCAASSSWASSTSTCCLPYLSNIPPSVSEGGPQELLLKQQGHGQGLQILPVIAALAPCSLPHSLHPEPSDPSPPAEGPHDALIQASLLEGVEKAPAKLHIHNLGKHHCLQASFKSTVWLLDNSFCHSKSL